MRASIPPQLCTMFSNSIQPVRRRREGEVEGVKGVVTKTTHLVHAIAFVILRSLILENGKCNETVRVLEHRW